MGSLGVDITSACRGCLQPPVGSQLLEAELFSRHVPKPQKTGQRAERFRSVDKTHGSRLYAVGGVQISCHLTTKATLLVPLRPCSPGCLGIGSFGPRLLSSCLLYESFHFLSF